MSNSIDDLLDSPEDNVDFDIGDEEEEALLDDNYDVTKKHKEVLNGTAELEETEEQDEQDFVLDLDNTTDFNEDENEENRVRQDRFQSERPVQQVEAIKEIITNPTRQDRNVRGNFRGRRPQRGGFRYNNYYNAQKRSNFQNNNAQNKRVLINPHFKGQVPVRNNVSLVWDKNVVKKPSLQVQPWAQVVRPQQNVPWIRPNSMFQPPSSYQSQINTGIPVQQKIGINPNIFIPPVNSHQYFQPPNVNVINSSGFQQTTYPPAQIITPQYGAAYNAMNQFAVPQYNVPQPVVGTYNASATMCLNPVTPNYTSAPSLQQNYTQPRYNMPSNNNNFQRTFTIKSENPDVSGYVRNDHQRGSSLRNVGLQARRRYLQGAEARGPRSNLQEIKTSDNIICENQDSKVDIKIEKDCVEEDESMIQYRQLIEHQKQLREKILRRKEERRKNAAKSSQSEEDTDALPPPEELLKTIDYVTVNMKAQTSLVVPSLTITKSNVPNAKMTVERSIPKPGRESVDETVDENVISSFLSNRKIIAKDDALPDTSVVVVSNLATGSTEVKLRKLCKGVGDVKNLVMSPLERQATIEFKSVASAHAFYKKYQRFMLDLSMIQVVLKES